jgi:hypothetical protein
MDSCRFSLEVALEVAASYTQYGILAPFPNPDPSLRLIFPLMASSFFHPLLVPRVVTNALLARNKLKRGSGRNSP